MRDTTLATSHNGTGCTRLLGLFGLIEEDGSLKRATYEDAHRIATHRVRHGMCYETWQVEHDNACRWFAKQHLLPGDRGFFLNRANVPLGRCRLDEDYAALCLAESVDCLYGDPPMPDSFSEEYDELRERRKTEQRPRVPEATELVFDFEIDL
jgi:hypothetical protein